MNISIKEKAQVQTQAFKNGLRAGFIMGMFVSFIIVVLSIHFLIK